MHTLPEPTAAYVAARQCEYNDDPRYFGADATVNLVFHQWPANTRYHEVLAKVVVLNRLYSTNIFNVYAVAEHIVACDIDRRLTSGDPDLVKVIARVALNGKSRNFYSFATKYCAFHNHTDFQIFDSYVHWLLWQYRLGFGYSAFKQDEVRDYRRFLDVIDEFKAHFGLGGLSRKAVDKFLWIEGLTQYNRIFGDPTASPMTGEPAAGTA